MLRHIMHVIIAALAFMIGVGWVDFFHLLKLSDPREERLSVIQPSIDTVSPGPARTSRDPPKPEQKTKFVCRDRLYLFVLDHLREQNGVGLGAIYGDEFISGAGIANCSELFEVEKRIDLNGDGRKEIIIRTINTSKGNFYCGATGNCLFWVIRQDKTGYKILLDAHVTKEVQVQTQKTSGYRDLVGCFDCGMLDRTLAHFKYRGGKYTLRKCFVDRMDIYGKSYITRKKLSWCK